MWTQEEHGQKLHTGSSESNLKTLELLDSNEPTVKLYNLWVIIHHLGFCPN